MRRILTTIALASISLLGVSTEARADRSAPSLRHTQTLVSEGHSQLQVMHRRHPHEYGGHDVKAERLLKMASRELSEAEDYRRYNHRKG